MTKNDLIKFEIIKSLHTIVKHANNEGIVMADLYDGIEDGGTPEDYAEEITIFNKNCTIKYVYKFNGEKFFKEIFF